MASAWSPSETQPDANSAKPTPHSTVPGSPLRTAQGFRESTQYITPLFWNVLDGCGEGESRVWETGMLSWLPSVILEHRALHAACRAHASRLRPEGHDVLDGSPIVFRERGAPIHSQTSHKFPGTLQYIFFFTNGRRGPCARSLPTTGRFEAPEGGLRAVRGHRGPQRGPRAGQAPLPHRKGHPQAAAPGGRPHRRA